jgi:hypothetical protein
MNCAAPEGTPPRRFNYQKNSARLLKILLRMPVVLSQFFMVWVRTIPVHARFNRARKSSFYKTFLGALPPPYGIPPFDIHGIPKYPFPTKNMISAEPVNQSFF